MKDFSKANHIMGNKKGIDTPGRVYYRFLVDTKQWCGVIFSLLEDDKPNSKSEIKRTNAREFARVVNGDGL